MSDYEVSPHGPVAACLPNFADMAGRTVESANEECINGGKYLVIRFVDGCALILRYSYEDSAWDEVPAIFYDVYGYDDAAKVYFGLITKEIAQANREMIKLNREGHQISLELAEFELLKAKFAQE